MIMLTHFVCHDQRNARSQHNNREIKHDVYGKRQTVGSCWGSKSEKIKRTEMINEYDKGGLKMIDIHSFNASLKIKWVQGYLNTDTKGKWKSVFDYYPKKHGRKLLFQGNL